MSCSPVVACYVAQLLTALHFFHHLGPVGTSAWSRSVQNEINGGLAESNQHLRLATYLSFSSVFFCVSLSTRFSPGANGGGGGGGAFGTKEGSGGGAGTATK